jgi:hypothetical protein
MSALARLLILAVAAAPNSQTRHPDAVEIFNCDFGRQWDVNYDGWPDKWQRRFGAGLPHYVAAAIADDERAASGRCLTVGLDGGGAYLEGPCVAVSDNFSYKVEASVRLQGVERARTRIRVEFCDENKKPLQRATSPWATGAKPWTILHIGPVNPSDDRIRLARVIWEVDAGEQPDLTGSVSLDEVWLARLPKMTVRTNSPFNVYTDNDIEVSVDLSGILDSDPDILFELLDASSQRIEDNRVQLEGRLITERRNKASDFIDSEANQRAAYAGSTSWRPPIRKHGFYRVRVTMQTSEGLLKRDVVNIALAPPLEPQRQGEFGWSLGREAPMSYADLAILMPRVGVNWVKLPVWYGTDEAAKGEQLVILAERLAAKDIEVVGVLDRPPNESALASKLSSHASIADALSAEPAAWLPLLDPVLSRLSLRVRWWQIGADHDCSFASMPRAEDEMLRLREQLFRFGQEVNIGLGWKWNQLCPQAPATWEFQQFTGAPPLTGDEIAEYLKLPRRPGVGRWVLIEPLSQDDYDLQTRARDLVEQMLAAKIHGADAIFAARPFDDDTGLMTASGAPSALLLPWRTTASLLSATKFLGSLKLPAGSHNRVFESPNGEVLMVVWSDRPTREVIELGSAGKVRVLDVWGREQLPASEGRRQIIEVDALPKFVLGLDPHMARWRMEASFASSRVPSVFGKPHPNKITVRNTFAQGVGGHVEFSAPKGWQISPQKIEFKLAAGETAALPFDALLPFDATSGKAPIRADFVVDAEQQYRFSQALELEVGDGEVQLETSTRLEDNGTLVIEQRMTNHSPELVDFKCLLYAPESNRRQQRAQVFQLGANPDVKVYRYPNGAELLGNELWLRAKEVNGDRVINHRFIVEQ